MQEPQQLAGPAHITKLHQAAEIAEILRKEAAVTLETSAKAVGSCRGLASPGTLHRKQCCISIPMIHPRAFAVNM